MGQLPKRALTIAGSDSGGGAGIQADLKTFTALGVYGMSVITSVTAQNTVSVLGINDIPPDFVALQIDAVLSDIGADAVKIGMLSNVGIVSAVARKLAEHGQRNVVLDPVMVSKGGSVLMEEGARDAMKNELFPLVRIITPNIPEAEEITGLEIDTLDAMIEAARAIKELGPEYVVVKGGHLADEHDAVDIFFDGDTFRELRSRRIDTKNTHGTGCTFAAAICASLAKGASPLGAVKVAKEFVTGAIENSFTLGSGNGPLNHFWKMKEGE